VRGVFGALVVHPRRGETEPHAQLYDGNGSDHVLMLQDFFSRSSGELHMRQHGGFSRRPTMSAEKNIVGIIPAQSVLINGRGWFHDLTRMHRNGCTRICRQDSQWFGAATTDSLIGDACVHRCMRGPHYEKNLHELQVIPGERVRLRIINAASLYTFRFSIDGHRMTVISTDGADVQPLAVDELIISSGERFDLILEANQPRANFWIRVDTLEEFSHGGLAVLRYDGADAEGEPIHAQRVSNPVVINCVDSGPISDRCLPLTALQRHHAQAPLYSPQEVRPKPHAFEVSWRGTAGKSPAHFVRILDLARVGNTFTNQNDGSYLQFAFPANPPMYFGPNVSHENTATIRAEHEEYVELIMQLTDRASHPFHLHGHKFEVMGVGYADFEQDCSILQCRSEPWYRESSHAHHLVNPDTAILKDTLLIPAGGWAVVRFRADNPGWWLLHCHMHIHLHDGMALVIDEAGDRWFDYFSKHRQGLSTRCSHAWEGTLQRHWISPWQTAKMNDWKLDMPFKGDLIPVACNCWEEPDMVMDKEPRSNYRCTNYYLCHHERNSLDPPPGTVEAIPRGARKRAEGRPWRIAMACIAFVMAIGMIGLRHFFEYRRSRATKGINIHEETLESIAPILFYDMSKASFEWKHVTVKAGTTGPTVLDNCSGKVEPGEVVGIMGPSGSGKTVLLDVLGCRRQRAGLFRTSGELYLGGEDLLSKHTGNRTRRRFSYMTQEVSLQENLSVFETLFFYARLQNTYKIPRDVLVRYVLKLIEDVGLGPARNRKVCQLSIGQQRRVAICSELLFPKAIIILDEPLSGLDASASMQIMQFLDQMARDRHTIAILTVHTPSSQLLQFFDKMLLMQRGGRPFYYGPRALLSTFLDSLGESTPDDWNAADWWLDVLVRWSENENGGTVPDVQMQKDFGTEDA
jgi:ABC-type multidrug transport system ATPase subunit/FtsP/CotA-like multicopper oxidase with cupredoxin domain